ncbi:MAG: ABC transporter ATP-binding protein [Polyangiaceae bacterium]
MTAAPLLEARGAALSVAGAPTLGPFDARTTGDFVVIAGDVGALVSLLTNVPLGALALARGTDPSFASAATVEISAGTLLVGGEDARTPAFRTNLGVAPLDPPLPVDLTAMEYLVVAAKLAGLGRAAKVEAARALDAVGAGAIARRKIVSLGVAERRILSFAQAIVARPPVLVVESPLAHLDDAASAYVLEAFSRAAEGRRAIVSADRAEAGGRDAAIVERASTILRFARGELVPSVGGAARYRLTVRSNADALAAELGRSGVELEGGPTRFAVSLPEGMTTDVILRAASVARAAVVDLSSLG